MKKEVKIIGLSINSKFGGLEATELTFDPNNRLTVVKGEVGSGKTTMNRALSLPTQGTKTLEDKGLYGDVDLTAQLLDGDHKIFVNTKSDAKGNLSSTIYTLDINGKKLKDVVIDGQKLTPANYLKSMQTALNWRMDELTSENVITVRNLLLELYSSELAQQGVVFDKGHSNYVGGIIDQIEKAKNKRNLMDMKRKEVGGIADDLNQKGIDSSERRVLKDVVSIDNKINEVNGKITYAKTNVEAARTTELNDLKIKANEIKNSLRDKNDFIKAFNIDIDLSITKFNQKNEKVDTNLKKIEECLFNLGIKDDLHIKNVINNVNSYFDNPIKPTKEKKKEIKTNENGQYTSSPDEFEHDSEIKELLMKYRTTGQAYATLLNKPTDIADTSKLESELHKLKDSKQSIEIWNNEAKSINSLHDWKDANEEVKNLQKDYFLKLTSINTGVEGLKIVPEENSTDVINLMYDGSYDVDYFHNEKKELRKLSAYSDTQKPMICLLVQNYLLSKKGKVLPYLWIDKVPIDKKTRALIERMSKELGLWLFVSWTGDFEKSQLKDGELLIENGEIFTNK